MITVKHTGHGYTVTQRAWFTETQCVMCLEIFAHFLAGVLFALIKQYET